MGEKNPTKKIPGSNGFSINYSKYLEKKQKQSKTLKENKGVRKRDDRVRSEAETPSPTSQNTKIQ